MGIFSKSVSGELRETLVGLKDEVLRLDGQMERMQESAFSRQGVGLKALRVEDIGWRLLAGEENVTEELDLSVIKSHSESARTLKAANPLVKRGVIVRNAYIWADPIKYPDNAKKVIDDPVNQQAMFSDQALEELESALATDGQYFLLLDRRKRQARQIPFSEITAVVTNPEHQDDIWYYKRSYTVEYVDSRGKKKAENREEFIPSVTFQGTPKARISDVKVNREKRIEHVAVNRQVGWRFGLPDLMGAVYWARAYKEYLEASFTLSKALARIAFKVTSQSGKGQKSVAASVARPTGPTDAGGVATLGMGQDLVALNKSGSNVDFGGGTALAAMVAASLDVPLSVLLTDGSAGGRQGAENALEKPTLNTMNARRKLHLASRKRVLAYFGIRDEPKWSKVSDDHLHRVLQAITLGQNTGTLHPEEIRGLVVRALDIVTDRDDEDIPEEYALRFQPQDNGDDDGDDEEDGRANGGAGPLSDGTNDSRDNPGGPTDA